MLLQRNVQSSARPLPGKGVPSVPAPPAVSADVVETLPYDVESAAQALQNIPSPNKEFVPSNAAPVPLSRKVPFGQTGHTVDDNAKPHPKDKDPPAAETLLDTPSDQLEDTLEAEWVKESMDDESGDGDKVCDGDGNPDNTTSTAANPDAKGEISFTSLPQSVEQNNFNKGMY